MLEIKTIRAKMSELDEIDWKKHPEAKLEYEYLEKKLKLFEQVPEETIGMKRLKELSADDQRKAYEKYVVPRIEDAKKGEGNPDYVKYWKDMTYEKWIEESADHYLEDDMPELMKDMPRAFGPFGMMAGWMSFRGKCIGYSNIIPDELRNKAYNDMEPEGMLSYAIELDAHSKEWEENPQNKKILAGVHKHGEKLKGWEHDNDWTVTLGMDKAKAEDHKNNLKEKYGIELVELAETLNKSSYYDYRNLVDAVTWLRFWADKGHGMHAWY